MINKHLSTSLLSVLLLLFGGQALWAQQSLHSAGGEAGETSISIGQTVYLMHSGNGGSATEGVQQIDCPAVAAADTAGCPLDTLTRMVPQEVGGTWQIVSSIGSTIDTLGKVTLGVNRSGSDDIDTVLYLLNGCTTEVTIVVHPYPAVNAINGGPYCAGDLGHLYETGGDGVSWIWAFPGGFSSGKKNPAVGPVVPGDYVVQVTDANGCIDKDTTTVCVSQLAQNCQPTVDIYLDANGQGNFDPTSLLNAAGQSECTLGGVIPQGLQTFSCDDVGGSAASFTITDSLGCAEACTTQVVVKDTIAPVPNCSSASTVVLVWEGTQLLSSSLGGTTTDNCGGDLTYSFSPDFATPSLTLTCSDLLQGSAEPVQVYIRDANGNVSDCSVTVGYAPESEDCDCQSDVLTLDGSVAPSDYKAKQTISSSGTVAAGDTVLFKAEQSITLQPGFSATAGSFFAARIDECKQQSKGLADMRADETPLAHGLTSEVYPNPFRNVFTLAVDLPQACRVSMTLTGLQGQQVRQLLSGEQMSQGEHRLTIDGSGLMPGMYVLSVRSGDQVTTHKIVKIQ